MDERYMDSMLFNYYTTQRNDYREYRIKAEAPVPYKPKVPKPKPPHTPLKDLHSLAERKDPCVPFSLMHTPTPIVRTNPYKVQQAFHKPPGEGKETSRATRPRLVMTPAVSMDDISDHQVRELLVKDMYISSAHRTMEEAVRLARKKPVTAPLPGLPARAKPIYLCGLREPVVSPEWRMETVSWDRRQLRAHVDPERIFWMKFDLYKDCASCKEFAQATRMRKLMPRKQ